MFTFSPPTFSKMIFLSEESVPVVNDKNWALARSTFHSFITCSEQDSSKSRNNCSSHWISSELSPLLKKDLQDWLSESFYLTNIGSCTPEQKKLPQLFIKELKIFYCFSIALGKDGKRKNGYVFFKKEKSKLKIYKIKF